MAWSNSKIFAITIADTLDETVSLDFDATGWLAALYNNSITPDNTVAASAAAYNAGVWGTANEQDDGTNWDAGGEPLTTNDITVSTTTVKWDADDTPSGTSTTTLSDVHGCLVYDGGATTPVADQAACYNYFGGANSVTSGTFTIVWSASGIFTISVA